MFNKIAGWSIFVAIVIVAVVAIYTDNKSIDFRTDVATCRDVREILRDEIPDPIVDFCKAIDDEVQARKQKADDSNILYLLERAAQEE